MSDDRFIPILRVKDARRSAVFYAGNFGFTIDWEHQFEPGRAVRVMEHGARVERG